MDGRVKPGHDAESVLADHTALGSIPLGSANRTERHSLLNSSQFSISPFENRERTLHNPFKRSVL